MHGHLAPMTMSTDIPRTSGKNASLTRIHGRIDQGLGALWTTTVKPLTRDQVTGSIAESGMTRGGSHGSRRSHITMTDGFP